MCAKLIFAGIQVGDKILEWDGLPLSTVPIEDIPEFVETFINSTVTVLLQRYFKHAKLKFTKPFPENDYLNRIGFYFLKNVKEHSEIKLTNFFTYFLEEICI